MVWFGLLLSCSGDEETAVTSADTATRETKILSLSPDLANGQSLYLDNCAACHAADGSGGIGSNIWDREFPVFVDAMLNSRTGMPRYADRLADQEIADIAHYGESLQAP
ncbi:MAG: cytochrome c [Myxococcota bacterium]